MLFGGGGVLLGRIWVRLWGSGFLGMLCIFLRLFFEGFDFLVRWLGEVGELEEDIMKRFERKDVLFVFESMIGSIEWNGRN